MSPFSYAAIIAVMLLVVVSIFVLGLFILSEIDYRKTVKHANNSEQKRKEQGKTVEEWYATGTENKD